jgi:hypothetical protein
MARVITKADLIDRAKAAGRRTPEHYRLWPDTAVLRELINREWAQGDQARILRGVTGDLLAEANDYQLDGELFAAAVQAAHHPTHRPRRDPAAARVNLVCRVHPDTRARFDAARAKTGEGLGELLDRLAAAL